MADEPRIIPDRVLEAEKRQFEHEARRIAAGGWRRATIGFGIGAVAGVLVALLAPRDEGPRRRTGPSHRAFRSSGDGTP